jgi:hypothetical protein
MAEIDKILKTRKKLTYQENLAHRLTDRGSSIESNGSTVMSKFEIADNEEYEFYLLEKQEEEPSPEAADITKMRHPLYQSYFNILYQELLNLEKMIKGGDVAEYVDNLIGFKNQDYYFKIKGFRLPFDSKIKIEKKNEWEFEKHKNIDEVRMKVYESRLKREEDKKQKFDEERS